MKKLIIIIILLTLFTGTVSAEEWTDFQKGLGINYLGLVATDLVQSQHWVEYTKDNPRILDNGFVYERNPIVAGKTIGQATALALVGNYVLYKALDKIDSKYRTIALIGINLIEGKIVYDNNKNMKMFGFEYKINFLQFNF